MHYSPVGILHTYQLSMLLLSLCTYVVEKCVLLPLPQIFQLEEANRIDIAGIKAHPWYTTPMPQLFEDALSHLTSAQAEIDQKVEAGVYQVSALSVWITGYLGCDPAWHTGTSFDGQICGL